MGIASGGAFVAALIIWMLVRRRRTRVVVPPPLTIALVATPGVPPSPPRTRLAKGSVAHPLTAAPRATSKTPSGRVTGLRPTHARR
jgi:hypothetical protein